MTIFRKLWIYYHTLRFLKINQIFSYILFYVKKNIINEHFVRKIINLSPGKDPDPCHLKIKPHLKTNHDLSDKTFEFLNIKVRFDENIEWNKSGLTKLWLYNLHYFDYLNGFNDDNGIKNFNIAKNVIIDWIKFNPAGFKNGWESYPLSLRVVNWILFYYNNLDTFNRQLEFKKIFLNSLYQQCAYLSNFIEFHIKANHLLKNGKALFFGGHFFKNNAWIETGQKILAEEIEEQILDDGGHFERSPMYHAIVLEDILDLVNLISAQRIITEQLSIHRLKSVLIEMLNWLNTMLQPDNDIPLFGDSAFAIALNLRQLVIYYEDVWKEKITFSSTTGLDSLDSSGYYIFRSSDQYLIVDGGELGVDYQPGHAHCDLLSYEYSFAGKRFIIDSGPGEYLDTDLRQKSRSIYGHNSVIVNNLEQADLWQSFRMGRRVKPELVKAIQNRTEDIFDATYRNNLSKSLAYRHHRNIKFIHKKFFVFTDKIETKRIDSIRSIIHIHGKCDVGIIDNSLKITQEEKTIFILYTAAHVSLKIEEGNYVSEFGKLMMSKKIIIEPINKNITSLSYIISPDIYFQDACTYFAKQLE